LDESRSSAAGSNIWARVDIPLECSETKSATSSNIVNADAVAFGALAADPADPVAGSDPARAPWYTNLVKLELMLVILLLIVLGLLFYLVFRWSQKTEQASYLGHVFQEAVFDFERSRLLRRVDEKRNRGEYLAEAESNANLKNKSSPEYPKPDPQLLPYLTFGRGRSGSGIGTGGLGGSSRPVGFNPFGHSNRTQLPGDAGRNPFPISAGERYFLNTEEEKLPDPLKGLWAKYEGEIADRERMSEEWYRTRDELENEAYQKEFKKAVKDAQDAAERAADGCRYRRISWPRTVIRP
jgi:hypothetical protein